MSVSANSAAQTAILSRPLFSHVPPVQVAKVIGIDNVTPAIEDAHHNAALNNILNAEFVCGKAEDALPLILAKHASSSSGDGHQEVVAVVDPPRAGLHKSVIRALMACKPLKRLVYVSCNPESLADNMVQLCTPARPGALPYSRC